MWKDLRAIWKFGFTKNNVTLISLKGDSDYLEKHNLETSGRYLRQQEQIKILTGKQFVNINCGVCNDCNGK